MARPAGESPESPRLCSESLEMPTTPPSGSDSADKVDRDSEPSSSDNIKKGWFGSLMDKTKSAPSPARPRMTGSVSSSAVNNAPGSATPSAAAAAGPASVASGSSSGVSAATSSDKGSDAGRINPFALPVHEDSLELIAKPLFKIIFLYAKDNLSLIRATQSGRLFADLKKNDTQRLNDEYRFYLYRAGKRFVFRSVAHGKFLTRGALFPRFTFKQATLLDKSAEKVPGTGVFQVIPQQLFKVKRYSLFVYGANANPRPLTIGIGNQVFPDGTDANKSRFVIIDDGTRGQQLLQDCITEGILAPGTIFPPVGAAAAVAGRHAGENGRIENAPFTPGPSTSLAAAALSNVHFDDSLGSFEPATPFGAGARTLPASRYGGSGADDRIDSTTVPSSRPGKGNKPARLAKSNSTSSLFIRDTITQPDINELTYCMSTALVRMITAGHENPNKVYLDAFDEVKTPLFVRPIVDDDYVGGDPSLPCEDDLFLFISPVFHKLKVKPPTGVLCMVFIDRLVAYTNLTIDASNWRRVVLSCLILATKVYEELTVWNVDFSVVFPRLSGKDLKVMELSLLHLLQYNVHVSPSVYAKYFFALRELSELDAEQFPLKPLDNARLGQLEASAQATQTRARDTLQKSPSMQFNTTFTSDPAANRAPFGLPPKEI